MVSAEHRDRLALVAMSDDRGRITFSTVIGSDGAACRNRPGSVAYSLLRYVADPDSVEDIFGPGGLVQYEPLESYSHRFSPSELDALIDGPLQPGLWHYGGMCFRRGTSRVSAAIRWITPRKMRNVKTFVYHLHRQGTPYAYLYRDGRWLCNMPMMREGWDPEQSGSPFVDLEDYFFGSRE